MYAIRSYYVLKQWEAQHDASDEELDPEELELRKRLAGYRGVWVVIEQFDGAAARVSWELLGSGRELADQRQVELAAVVIGHQVEHRNNFV